MLTGLLPHHRTKLDSLLRRVDEFTEEEALVALELVDEALERPDGRDYLFVIDEDENGELSGYACWGEVPMTRGCFDLYWIAVDPKAQGRGVGQRLLDHVERTVRAEGGRLLRVETAGLAAYERTRRFYERAGYESGGRIRDFYWPGNDLCVFVKYLDDRARR